MSDVTDEHLMHEARERLEALHESPDLVTRDALAGWIQKSPRHAAAYLRESALDDALHKATSVSKRRVADWIEFGRKAYGTDIPEKRREDETSSRHYPAIGAGVSILLLLGVALVLWFWWNHWSWVDYRSTAADSRQRVLEEGSSIQLYANSAVQVRIVAGRRDVRLLEGGCTFRVRHDPEHPFRVAADRARVEAVGTGFNVLLKDNATGIYVFEGSVQASGDREQVLLKPHQSADISKSGRVTELHQASDDTSAGSSAHTATLEELAAAVNRRNHFPQIRVADDARNLRYSSSIDLDDPDVWVRSLETYDNLDVRRDGERVTISLAHKKP